MLTAGKLDDEKLKLYEHKLVNRGWSMESYSRSFLDFLCS